MRADARRNRELILAAADQAFAQDGLGVPVDRIAERAGVGAGTLYRHFPTKEALFEAVVVEHMQRLAADGHAALESGHPGRALFEFMGRLAVEASAKRNLIDALVGAGVDIKQAAAGPKAEVEQVFGQLLERAQAAGEVRPDVTVSDLFALIMGSCAFAGEGSDWSPDRMLSVVCTGLQAAPPG
ncbi:MAG TPA: TetR/AcrR family transcriptional regulator [Acidimicrobiales bacterium]|nr:TetR/AcrR family transcriptional regulator [Acidimicrobiales bacterium]